MPNSPQFSESSFAFAFVENLLNGGLVHSSTPPIFLSTAVEGRPGGHFDVKIPSAPVAFLIQFKIPSVMRRGARLGNGARLNLPFYRMELREARGYAQHLGLCAWEGRGENVYYVSPRYHLENDFHMFYRSRSVPEKSAFFRPSSIKLPDYSSKHSVVYDRLGRNWETRSIPIQGEGPIDWSNFNEQISAAVENAEVRSPKEFLHSLVEDLGEAAAEGHRKAYGLLYNKRVERDSSPTEKPFNPDWDATALSAAQEAAKISRVMLVLCPKSNLHK